MKVKESSIARLIDRMERDGLVERIRNQQDKRFINLSLTAKGKELTIKLLPEGKVFQDLLYKNISDEEIKNFTMILAKMVNNVKEDNNQEYTHEA